MNVRRESVSHSILATPKPFLLAVQQDTFRIKAVIASLTNEATFFLWKTTLNSITKPRKHPAHGLSFSPLLLIAVWTSSRRLKSLQKYKCEVFRRRTKTRETTTKKTYRKSDWFSSEFLHILRFAVFELWYQQQQKKKEKQKSQVKFFSFVQSIKLLKFANQEICPALRIH